jgi:hypothetical protein
MQPDDQLLQWPWSVQSLDLHDPLNDDIWKGSKVRGASLRGAYPSAGGLQDIALESHIPLPWVPDLVGCNWPSRADVLVIGSAYSPFFGSAGRVGTITVGQYIQAGSPADFLRNYVSGVVAPDRTYYRILHRLLTGIAVLENAAFTDLAKVAFVTLNGAGGYTGGDGAVKAARPAFDAYVRAGEDWTWRRLEQCPRGVVVTLGAIATTELLMLLERRGCVLQTGNGANGALPRRSRKGSVSLRPGSWCTASYGSTQYTVASVYHPSRQNQYDEEWAKSRKGLVEALAAARSRV